MPLLVPHVVADQHGVHGLAELLPDLRDEVPGVVGPELLLPVGARGHDVARLLAVGLRDREVPLGRAARRVRVHHPLRRPLAVDDVGVEVAAVVVLPRGVQGRPVRDPIVLEPLRERPHHLVARLGRRLVRELHDETVLHPRRGMSLGLLERLPEPHPVLEPVADGPEGEDDLFAVGELDRVLDVALSRRRARRVDLALDAAPRFPARSRLPSRSATGPSAARPTSSLP